MWEGNIHLVPGARPIFVPSHCFLTEDRAGPLRMLQTVVTSPLTGVNRRWWVVVKKNHSKLKKQIQKPDVRKTLT